MTVFAVFASPVALAGDCVNGKDSETELPCFDLNESPTTAEDFETMIQTVFNVVFGILVTVASFMLLYAAFEYLTARGESEKLAKARNMIVYAIVALVVAVFAWGLPRVILSFLG